MRALAQGQASSVSNPVLDVFVADSSGILKVPFALSFAIFDISDATKAKTPVQVVAKTALNLVTSRLHDGHYVAPFTPAGNAAVGRYEIRWYLQLTSTDTEVEWRVDFEVLTEVARQNADGYALVSDLRDEGVTTTVATDARAQAVLGRASRYIERITGRTFGAQWKSVSVDGRGRNILSLSEPVIAVGRVLVKTDNPVPVDQTIDPSYFRVYNRHLKGLRQPDDRDAPRLAFVDSRDIAGAGITLGELGLTNLRWPQGNQNVHIEGVFGFTDPHGASPYGVVPEDIRWVCMLLAYKQLPKLTQSDERDDRVGGYRVTSMRTRDQSISYDPRVLQGSLTGDSEVDQILLRYMRPPMFGAA